MMDRQIIQQLHDAMDKANGEYGEQNCLCLFCKSKAHDGKGLIHKIDCPIRIARKALYTVQAKPCSVAWCPHGQPFQPEKPQDKEELSEGYQKWVDEALVWRENEITKAKQEARTEITRELYKIIADSEYDIASVIRFLEVQLKQGLEK
jgi:ferredoxin-thioredoxin reductase catalytic subunit